MTAYDEVRIALLQLIAQERELKRRLREIEKTKIELAYILGGGKPSNTEPDLIEELKKCMEGK